MDPKLLNEIDCKAKQILIDTSNDKLMGASLAEIKEKVSALINEIADLPPPKDTTILNVSKLHRGGITVLFKEKEVVEWLQDKNVELRFMSGIATNAKVIKRQYPTLVPRIPTTFDPLNGKHLREIEETNELPEGSIIKARWIKPEHRRSLEQHAAHAIFTLNEAGTANRCIRDSIQVCALKVHPSRLKHEPMQCMKCRHWGHFANICSANLDTCRTCRGPHRTNICVAVSLRATISQAFKAKVNCQGCVSY